MKYKKARLDDSTAPWPGTVQPVVNALYPTFTAILLHIYGGCSPRTIKKSAQGWPKLRVLAQHFD
jgi:hypothetical protein